MHFVKDQIEVVGIVQSAQSSPTIMVISLKIFNSCRIGRNNQLLYTERTLDLIASGISISV